MITDRVLMCILMAVESTLPFDQGFYHDTGIHSMSEVVDEIWAILDTIRLPGNNLYLPSFALLLAIRACHDCQARRRLTVL